MAFNLFSYLNDALCSMEARVDRVSKTARIWPSEASAELLQPGKTNIIGGCHRRTFFRLIGEPTKAPMTATGARRVRTGKSVEMDVVNQAIEAKLHIANGCRMYVPKIDLAFELDLVVLDPKTGQPVICENKSIYGYMATKSIIKDGVPKLEHLLQILLYINEIRTAGHLKQVIIDGIADKESGNKRNRIQVTKDNVDILKDDSKIYGKLCYETRDTCETREIDIDIYEEFDGSHYPMIDGQVCKIFTIENIYDRFLIVQNYYNNALKEVTRILTEQGITEPILAGEKSTYEERQQIKEYWDRVGQELRRLPLDFLPPADYQYKYSDHKIEDLRAKGLIGETKYKEWKTFKAGRRRKPGIPIIGDFQCSYCPFKYSCIPLQNPELKPMIQDIVEEHDEGT